MAEEYLGILGSGDPLYAILASRAFPDIPDPIFHVSKMSRDTVFKYTEERTGKALIGKFYNSDMDHPQGPRINEYDPEIKFREITQRNSFYMALAELRIARNNYLDVGYRKKLAYEALQCLTYGLDLL